jgi:hypothetical protein
MKSSFWISFIFIVLIFSCNKSKQEDSTNGPAFTDYKITISGIVTDQVNGNPVADAKVYCGIQWRASPSHNLYSPESSTTTDKDGRYQLISTARKTSGYKLPLSMASDVIAVIATKSGFAGSNRPEISCYNAQNCPMDIKMYHISSLNLHIVNDTLDLTDNVRISVDELFPWDGLWENTSMPFFTLDCNKRLYDTTLILNDLWGNWGYFVSVLKPGGSRLNSSDIFNEFEIIPKPDTINTSKISY